MNKSANGFRKYIQNTHEAYEQVPLLQNAAPVVALQLALDLYRENNDKMH